MRYIACMETKFELPGSQMLDGCSRSQKLIRGEEPAGMLGRSPSVSIGTNQEMIQLPVSKQKHSVGISCLKRYIPASYRHHLTGRLTGTGRIQCLQHRMIPE